MKTASYLSGVTRGLVSVKNENCQGKIRSLPQKKRDKGIFANRPANLVMRALN